MKGLIGLLVMLTYASGTKGQSYGYYLDGYLLIKKDTTRCKLWFNPDTPYFKNELNALINYESRIISLEKNDSLSGFGIVSQEYKVDYGKIRLQGLNSWEYNYARKIVTGIVELYEYPFFLVKRDTASMGLIREKVSAYFISRTDNEKKDYPEFIKSMRIKKIAKYLNSYPDIGKLPDREMSPDELAELLRTYNSWFTSGRR